MDVNSRIEEQLKSHDMLLYMKGTPDAPQCGFSAKAAAVMKTTGVAFAYVDVLARPLIMG